MNDKPEMPTPDTPQVLLEHHLKALRLPTILSEYDKVARQCAAEQVDYPRYLLRLTELELLDRDRRAIERRIRQAKFPVVKSLDSFEFLAIPSLNKALVLELARCEFLSRKENLLLLGNSGTGKTHIALALGLSACQRGHRVRFTTAAALVRELIEARDEKHLLRFQKLLASYELLIVDELGYVPLSKSGAELLFETFSQRYERASTLVTSNLKCVATHFRFNVENIFMRALIAESPGLPLFWMLLSPHKSWGCQGCDQFVARTKAA
jgi:DNA replication protein DnaC